VTIGALRLELPIVIPGRRVGRVGGIAELVGAQPAAGRSAIALGHFRDHPPRRIIGKSVVREGSNHGIGSGERIGHGSGQAGVGIAVEHIFQAVEAVGGRPMRRAMYLPADHFDIGFQRWSHALDESPVKEQRSRATVGPRLAAAGLARYLGGMGLSQRLGILTAA
jgi:hypothetical protein